MLYFFWNRSITLYLYEAVSIQNIKKQADVLYYYALSIQGNIS